MTSTNLTYDLADGTFHSGATDHASYVNARWAAIAERLEQTARNEARQIARSLGGTETTLYGGKDADDVTQDVLIAMYGWMRRTTDDRLSGFNDSFLAHRARLYTRRAFARIWRSKTKTRDDYMIRLDHLTMNNGEECGDDAVFAAIAPSAFESSAERDVRASLGTDLADSIESTDMIGRVRQLIGQDMRRQHILTLLLNGYAQREIGEAMGIARGTVRYHISAIRETLEQHGGAALLTP